MDRVAKIIARKVDDVPVETIEDMVSELRKTLLISLIRKDKVEELRKIKLVFSEVDQEIEFLETLMGVLRKK